MKCSKAKKLISDHMDGELDAKKASSLEEHMEACPECRMLFKDFERIASKARALAKREPSGKVWFRIIERLKEEGDEESSPDYLAALKSFEDHRPWREG